MARHFYVGVILGAGGAGGNVQMLTLQNQEALQHPGSNLTFTNSEGNTVLVPVAQPDYGQENGLVDQFYRDINIGNAIDNTIIAGEVAVVAYGGYSAFGGGAAAEGGAAAGGEVVAEDVAVDYGYGVAADEVTVDASSEYVASEVTGSEVSSTGTWLGGDVAPAVEETVWLDETPIAYEAGAGVGAGAVAAGTAAGATPKIVDTILGAAVNQTLASILHPGQAGSTPISGSTRAPSTVTKSPDLQGMINPATGQLSQKGMILLGATVLVVIMLTRKN